ncbi:hypothetical protein QVD17_07753 [Tagetes erecta]|uniref:Uncharacterized protein n=1 Tax=Tagetes erecta TaxID=13708 RepID=A0AAD8P478_TARER|nr:hypothetical protein QVD17_07753 [Tagetes erecta]
MITRLINFEDYAFFEIDSLMYVPSLYIIMAHEIKQTVVVEFEARFKPKLEATLKQIQNWVSEPIEAALTNVSRFASMTDDEFEASLKHVVSWVPNPVEGFVIGAVGGAAIGCFVDFVDMAVHYVLKSQKPTHATIDPQSLSHLGWYQPLAKSLITGSGWELARNIGAMHGVGTCIYCVMKNLRYINERETRMMAAFGSAVTLSLMTGLTGEATISFSFMYALMIDGMFKVNAKDLPRDKTRNKFSCIGLGIDHHGRNFNTSFFTSDALSLDHRQEGGDESNMVLMMNQRTIKSVNLDQP